MELNLGIDKDVKAKPFLRWAGGKRWLIKHVPDIFQELNFNQYHEPFLGAGSFFFRYGIGKESFLSDLNSDLINTYKQIKTNPKGVVESLSLFKNTKTEYYNIRSSKPENETQRAAIFIYLNMYSFNGIYRVNALGEYNVPYGYRKDLKIDEDNFYRVSESLKNVTLEKGDFGLCKKNIKKDDLIFLDPPYTVSHNNNGFIEYNQKIFKLEDQVRLKKLIDFIKDNQAFYILTNAAHHSINDIFGGSGDRKVEINRKSLIGGNNAKRGDISEYIFTNIV